MFNIPSFHLNGQLTACILFTIPGCKKCEKVKSKLNEMGLVFQSFNIFEHRLLLQNVPIEKKRQGFPLLKIRDAYYTYIEIMDTKNE